MFPPLKNQYMHLYPRMQEFSLVSAALSCACDDLTFTHPAETHFLNLMTSSALMCAYLDESLHDLWVVHLSVDRVE